MRYLLRDIFSDVIEAAQEAGIWQTLTLDEKEEIVKYFLQHFDSLMREACRVNFYFLTTSVTAETQRPGQAKGGA